MVFHTVWIDTVAAYLIEGLCFDFSLRDETSPTLGLTGRAIGRAPLIGWARSIDGLGALV